MITALLITAAAALWLASDPDDGRGQPQEHQPLVDVTPSRAAKGQP